MTAEMRDEAVMARASKRRGTGVAAVGILLAFCALAACGTPRATDQPLTVAGEPCGVGDAQICGISAGNGAVLSCLGKVWQPAALCGAGALCVATGGAPHCLSDADVAAMPGDASAQDDCQKEAGCGDNPEIGVWIDGVPPVEATCAHFASDDTGGIIKQTHTVTVTNIGTQGSLCLNAVQFTTSATQLMKISWGAHTVDASACPGAFAALQPGKSLVGAVDYAPSPGLGDQATLTLDHNDFKNPQKYNQLCFDVVPPGPILQLLATQLIWVNPPTGVPMTQCVEYGNSGGAPLTVTAPATIEPANPQYQIANQPQVGDSIAALGAASNPSGKPMTLQVCVILTDDGNPNNNQASLILHTNDPATPNASIQLDAKFQQASSITVTGQGSPSGAIGFDFNGLCAGGARTCSVHNDGPQPFAWNNPAQIVAIAPSTQAEVDAAYALTMQKNGTQVAQPSGAGSLPAGASMDYTITFTPLANGKATPAARLLIPYDQMPLPPGTLEIAILGCGTAVPDLAPQQLWLYATMGQKTVGHIAFANQGSAPLGVVKACINSNNPAGADPCANAQYASKYFSFLTPVGASPLPPSSSGAGNGLLGLDVQFAPTDDLHTNDLALLNLVYCASGSVAGGDCQPANQTINLTGNTEAGVVQPTATLAPPAASPGAGKLLTIDGKLTAGAFPNGQTWSWALIDRPPGSLAWIGAANQATSDPSVSFVPDVKGKYTVQAMALTVASNFSQLAWTPPTTVSVVVP